MTTRKKATPAATWVAIDIVKRSRAALIESALNNPPRRVVQKVWAPPSPRQRDA